MQLSTWWEKDEDTEKYSVWKQQLLWRGMTVNDILLHTYIIVMDFAVILKDGVTIPDSHDVEPTYSLWYPLISLKDPRLYSRAILYKTYTMHHTIMEISVYIYHAAYILMISTY